MHPNRRVSRCPKDSEASILPNISELERQLDICWTSVASGPVKQSYFLRVCWLNLVVLPTWPKLFRNSHLPSKRTHPPWKHPHYRGSLRWRYSLGTCELRTKCLVTFCKPLIASPGYDRRGYSRRIACYLNAVARNGCTAMAGRGVLAKQ